MSQEYVTETHIDARGVATIVQIPMAISAPSVEHSHDIDDDIINCVTLNATTVVTGQLSSSVIQAQDIETTLIDTIAINAERMHTPLLQFSNIKFAHFEHSVNTTYNDSGAFTSGLKLKGIDSTNVEETFAQIHAQEAYLNVPLKLFKMLDPSYEGALLIVDGPAEFQKITTAEITTAVFETDLLVTPTIEPDIIKFGDLSIDKFQHTRQGTYNDALLYSDALRINYHNYHQLVTLTMQKCGIQVPVRIVKQFIEPDFDDFMLTVDGKVYFDKVETPLLEAGTVETPEIKLSNDVSIGIDNDKLRVEVGPATNFTFGPVSPCIVFQGDPEFYFSGDLLFKVSPATALINSPEILLKCGESNAIFANETQTEIANALICDNVTVNDFLICSDITIDTLHSTDYELSIVEDLVHSDARYNQGADLFVERISTKLTSNPVAGDGVDKYEIMSVAMNRVDIGVPIHVGQADYDPDRSIHRSTWTKTHNIVASFYGKVKTYEGGGGKASSTLSHYCITEEQIQWSDYSNRIVSFTSDARYFAHDTGQVYTNWNELSNKHALSSVTLTNSREEHHAGIVGGVITPDASGHFEKETNAVVSMSKVSTSDTVLDVHCSGDMMLWVLVDTDTTKLLSAELLTGQWEYWKNTTMVKHVYMTAEDTSEGVDFMVNDTVVDTESLNARVLMLEQIIESLTQ